MKIYLVHPISGLSADDVFGYYERTAKDLTELGYDVLTPVYAKQHLRCEKEFRATGYKSECSTNHALFTRDRWMVKQADIIYANFLLAKGVSIGSMMELAWASDSDKHVVVSMQEENIHQHAFVLEAASVIYDEHDKAMAYLKNLVQKRF